MDPSEKEIEKLGVSAKSEDGLALPDAESAGENEAQGEDNQNGQDAPEDNAQKRSTYLVK